MIPGSVRRVRIRLLPWRPRWRSKDVDGLDAPDFLDAGGDDLFGVVIGFVVLLLVAPFVLVAVVGVVLLSVELLLVLALLPFAMLGQVVGALPWVLVVTGTDGVKQAISVTGTRDMLSARRYYRSLRA